MNKILLSAAIIASLGIAAIAPQTARAADGTITITGKVVAQTCTVNGNAFGTPASVNVALPLVLAPVLTSAGSVAGTTPFSIAIANCDPALTSVQTFFSGGNIDGSTGNLKNTGTATKVQVQLLNSGAAVMPLNGGTASLQNSPTATLSSGAATLNYSAQYISPTGGATPGSVNTSVAFTMIYQ
jgi:major type 1 subunit fimbrin (pilin)